MEFLWKYDPARIPGETKPFPDSPPVRTPRDGPPANKRVKKISQFDDTSYVNTTINIKQASFNTGVLWQAPFALDMTPLTDDNVTLTDIIMPGTTSRKYSSEGKGDNTSLKLGERGIVNPIWQYNETADPRTNGIAGRNYGRVYQQRIRANNPIVFIQPGRPKFFGSISFLDGGNGAKDAALRNAILGNSLLSSTDDLQGPEVPTIQSFIDELSENDTDAANSGSMKFYDFEPDFFRYRAYVRSLCEEFMVRLGLLDLYKNPDSPFGAGVTDPFTQFMDYYGIIEGSVGNAPGGKYQSGYMPFRVEKTTDASDTFSNEIGASSFASQIKGQSENMKELLFLTGGGAGATSAGNPLENITKAITENVIGGVSGIVSEQASAIIQTGGNIMFPEIWKDSTYSKTLTIQIKLHSPSAHPKARFENLYFPLACLIPLAFPRQASAAVYMSPPLIRLYSKGWFSCDMGMVDSITIKRGTGVNEWTSDNMPRTIDVTLNIKDLFTNMMLSIGGSAKHEIKIFSQKNSILRDYLNTLCGVDTFAAAKLSARFKQWFELRVKYGAARLLDPKNWISGIQGWAPFINISKIANAFW
jgi:hypothetical protein